MDVRPIQTRNYIATVLNNSRGQVSSSLYPLHVIQRHLSSQSDSYLRTPDQRCILMLSMSYRTRCKGFICFGLYILTNLQDIKGNWKKLGSGSFGNVYKGGSSQPCFLFDLTPLQGHTLAL